MMRAEANVGSPCRRALVSWKLLPISSNQLRLPPIIFWRRVVAWRRSGGGENSSLRTGRAQRQTVRQTNAKGVPATLAREGHV